jgi:hypothetical protein
MTNEKVEEDDAEGPDIIEQGRIRAVVGKLSTENNGRAQKMGNKAGGICKPGLMW